MEASQMSLGMGRVVHQIALTAGARSGDAVRADPLSGYMSSSTAPWYAAPGYGAPGGWYAR
jgi:hypothetical protein